MYHHLLEKVTEVAPQWKGALVKNTLLIVALLLEEKTCSLWQLKGSVGKLLGNTATDSRSHYQRLKRWLWSGEQQKGIWIELLRAAVSLLKEQSTCLILDGSGPPTRVRHWGPLEVGRQKVSLSNLKYLIPRREYSHLLAGVSQARHQQSMAAQAVAAASPAPV